MTAKRWTKDQKRAIEIRGKDVLVAAAAGSGKTSVLVERVVRRLLDPEDATDVDRLLVVTFTEAAAAEMRERIRLALEETRNDTADIQRAQRAERQLALIGKASISTLHGFCLEIIRKHFYLIGIDPRFRVMDDEEATLIKRDVLDELFEEAHQWVYFGESDETELQEVQQPRTNQQRGEQETAEQEKADEERAELKALFDDYGGRRDDRDLREIVLQLYEYICSLPDGEAWVKKSIDSFDIDSAEGTRALDLWKSILCQHGRFDVEQAISQLQRAKRICSLPMGPDEYNLALDVTLAALSDVEDGLIEEDWERVRSALKAVNWPRFKQSRESDANLKEEVKKLRDGAKKTLEKLGERVFARSFEGCIEDLARLAPVVRSLCSLVDRFSENYTRRKREQGVADFTDLERLALQALTSTVDHDDRILADEYRDRFDEVFVDEYQDINPVQDRLITLVSREGEGLNNRFLVGDVKQSIYRFRLADPRIFQEKYVEFADPNDTGSCRIDLQANFRSHEQILHAVNFHFRQLMQEDVGDIGYDPDAELIPGSQAQSEERPGGNSSAEGSSVPAPRVELHLVERAHDVHGIEGSGMNLFSGEHDSGFGLAGGGGSESWGFQNQEGDGGSGLGLTQVEREATLVGTLIQRLVQEGYNYRDIVVLMRSPKGRVGRFIEVLDNFGIPAFSQAGAGFFYAPEVQVVTSLLRLLDNPRQDIPLAAVLRSPMVLLDSRDLAAIRANHPQGEFIDAVRAYAGVDEGDQDGVDDSAGRVSDLPRDQLAQRLEKFLKQLNRWRTDARRLPLSKLLWRIYDQTGYFDFVGGLPRGARRQANLMGLERHARRFDRYATLGLSRFIGYLDDLDEAGTDVAPPATLGEGEDVVQVMSVHQSKGLEFPIVILCDLDRQWNKTDTRRPLIFHRDLGIAPAVIDRKKRVRYPSIAHRAAVVSLDRETLAEEMRLLYVAMTRPKERLIMTSTVRDLPGRCATWSEAARLEGWARPAGELMSARSWLDWIAASIARHADGEPIRALGAGELGSDYYRPVDQQVASDGSRYSVRLWDGDHVDSLAPQSAIEDEDPLPWHQISRGQSIGAAVDFELAQRLEAEAGWRYSAAALTQTPAKLSVTEITRAEQALGDMAVDEDAEDWSGSWEKEPLGLSLSHDTGEKDFQGIEEGVVRLSAPRLMAERMEIGPMERGSAMHSFLARINLSQPITLARLQEEKEALVQRELLTRKEAESIDLEAVCRFFQTETGQRILKAPKLWRELPFTMRASSLSIWPPASSGEDGDHATLDDVNARDDRPFTVVQGTIDCLVRDERGFLIVDYKSDWVPWGGEEKAAAGYTRQVSLYADFVRSVAKDALIEAALVFMRTGVAVSVPVVSSEASGG